MKPGVKRDLILVVSFAVAVILWGGLGFVLAPPIPVVASGNDLERSQAIAMAEVFLQMWKRVGISAGFASLLLYSAFRFFSGLWKRGHVEEKKPEDHYLSGTAVGVIIGLFAIAFGVFAYMVSSGR